MNDTVSVSAFQDVDLVYVDPDARAVVGRVEWGKTGNPKSMPIPKQTDGEKTWRKFYPWGTYRSMRNVYRLEGKQGKKQPEKTLEQVIPLALEQPFWS